MKTAHHVRLAMVVLAVLCVFAPLSSHADEPPGLPTPASTAPAPVTNPAAVVEHYREVMARPEFQDNGKIPVRTKLETYLAQWFKRLGSTIGEFKYATRMPAFESMLMSVLVVVCVAALLYIMVRLTRRRGRMDMNSEERVPHPKTFRPPESYDEEIQEAIRDSNWHAAWLGAWRQFLSRLENRHLVEADRTRTNREYLAQLRGQSLPASAVTLLTSLVDAYDRFIYGRKSIAEPDWTLFHHQIEQAGLLLHLEDKAAQKRAMAEAL
jgi:hypothetical protein